MAEFTPSKKTAQDFNNGIEYIDGQGNETGDAVQAETMNNLVEGALYAQEQAESAVSTASDAVDTANNALAVANSLDGQIKTANDTANEANATSEEAKNIAEEAREIANDAQKGVGTKVQVNGVFQPTLDFTSDPQEQLDGKVNKSGGTVTGRLTLAGGASIYSGNESTHIELGNVGRTSLEFHAQSDPNVFLDYDATIQASNATSQTDYGSAILEYIAREHRFTKGDIYNSYGQAMRGFKTVTQGSILNDVKSGFYSDGYDLYSKSVVVGEGNDKFVLTWDFGGTYSRGLWVRAYSNKDLAVEQKALLINPVELEVSTANGWTIGGTDLARPVDGVYVLTAKTGLGWLQPVGFSFGRYGIATQAGLLNVSIQYINSWSARILKDDSSVAITQVAYKKLI